MLTRIERWCDRLAGVVASICVLGMLALAGITMLDVLMRWLFNAPLPGLNEIVEMGFAVAIAATIPAGMTRGVNLKIDLVSRWVGGRLEAGFNALGATVLLAFYALVAWQITRYADTLTLQGRTTIILGWPKAPFIYAVALLLWLGIVVQLVLTLTAIGRAITAKPGHTHPIFVALTLVVAIPFGALLVDAMVDFPGLAAWAQGHVGLTVTLAFIIMWFLTLALIPLAAVMGLAAIFGAALFIGFPPALSAAGSEVTGFLTNSQVATLPLFLMMGSFAAAADISEDVYRLAHAVLGRFRGGLALATIGGCAGFGSLTGSSLATSAIIGRVSLPEMLARGYSPAFATGCCAAGGTLGALMPPASGPLILFALLSEASIGQLFTAAIVPGLLAIALYFVTVMIYVRVAPGAAPAAVQMGREDVLGALRRCGFVALLFGSVLGGIYTGVFTPTEAAAVGAFEAFLCAAVRGKLRGGRFWHVLAETTGTTALIYGLIFGAQIFSFFVSVSALTEAATAFIKTLNLSPFAVIAWILAIYLMLGSLMESFAVLVITVPIVTPLVVGMGFDINWWGILNLCVVETGLIHPPLGLNVFVLKSMQPDVPMWTIYRGVFPFVGADLLKLTLLVLFPPITLWLTTIIAH